MKQIFQMFFCFLKIGAFTFGGGYAMIPLIEKEFVDNKGWISKDDFVDIIVLSQSLPGALAVNSSLFVGYKIRGVIGALLALLGVVIPSFCIIIIISILFVKFRNNPIVIQGFNGIKAAVPMLVLFAIISLGKSLKKNIPTLSIMVISIFLLLYFNLHPIFLIILSINCGIIFFRKKV
ncbi:chromate transporter [Oceanirhabdus sp. W0125-5]|uniref:chromate transporter n=1 Tax=Oceanirhabdus sp. W0125-5 TaxID=2999116 RepID=UPI0022F33135|nr:chromate transporter [Oceanirhabdus sp. W0125-5]WBW98728.1 chromate transporter [Oceanirhabdus sp. W0125-5]